MVNEWIPYFLVGFLGISDYVQVTQKIKNAAETCGFPIFTQFDCLPFEALIRRSLINTEFDAWFHFDLLNLLDYLQSSKKMIFLLIAEGQEEESNQFLNGLILL